MGKLKIYLTGKLEGNKSIDNFNNDFRNSKKALVFLMAEWCGHCKIVKSFLDPIYEKYDNKEYNGDDIVIGAFHEDEYSQLDSNIDTNINGFPTIKQYTNGSNEEMANTLDRSTQEGIEQYIDMMIEEVKNTDNVKHHDVTHDDVNVEEDASIKIKPNKKMVRRRTKCKKNKKKLQRQKRKITKQKRKIKYLEDLITRKNTKRRGRRRSYVNKSKKSKSKKNTSKKSKSKKSKSKKNKLSFMRRLLKI